MLHHVHLNGNLRTAPHAQLVTLILPRIRTVPPRALHSLQNFLFHSIGMGTLYREDIFLAIATYLLAKRGRATACSNNATIR